MTSHPAMTAERATLGNAGARSSEIPGMTTEPAAPYPPVAPPPRPRRWPWIFAIIAAALLAGGTAFVFSHGLAPTSTPPAATFTITGQMTVSGALWDNQSGVTPTPCYATGGFTDITPGAPVTVANPQGQVVATGALESGREGDGYTCEFPFTVPNVPDGLGSYSITISHRGTQVLTPDAAHAPVDLALGGS